MAESKGRAERFKDGLRKNRNKIFYVLAVAALFLALAEWALLPGQVGLGYHDGELTSFVSKNTAILAHLALSLGFGAMFWKWPREIAYLVGSGLGILVTLGVLVTNLRLV